jgi:hypothetical protein
MNRREKLVGIRARFVGHTFILPRPTRDSE